MNIGNKRIILGSASPRRKELLAGLDIPFIVDTGNNFDEIYGPDIEEDKIPEVLSEGKSYGFHRPHEEDEILITSDTLVLCENCQQKHRVQPISRIFLVRHLLYG
jgi:septum formation protein